MTDKQISEEQLDILKDVVSTLTTVKNNKDEEYSHFHFNGVSRIEEVVDREQHLESMIEWVIDIIEQNFDLEDEE